MKSKVFLTAILAFGILITHILPAATADECNRRLIISCEKGDLEDVKMSLSAGADINCSTVMTGAPQEIWGGETPLTAAALYGHLGVVKYLLENGADPNKPNSQDDTPLVSATEYPKIVTFLLKKGANVNKDVEGIDPIMSASAGNNIRSLKILVKAGGDVNRQCKVTGETALMKAAFFGAKEATEILLKAGADPEIKRGMKFSDCGLPEDTALSIAIKNKEGAIVKLLQRALKKKTGIRGKPARDIKNRKGS